MRLCYIFLIAAALVLQTNSATAASDNNWDCPLPFGGDIGAYVECMQSAATAAVDDALENSPFMAQLPAERAILTMARNSGLNDIAQCLNQAGIQYGTVIGNAVNDPWNLVENRMAVLMTDAIENSAGRLNGMLSRVASGNPQAVQNINVAQVVDEIYNLMIGVASADPVASCALPMFNNQAELTKQVALQTYGFMVEQNALLMQNVIQPAINTGTAALMTSMLQEMGANASGQASTSQRPPRRTTPPPQRTRLKKDADTKEIRRTTDRNVVMNKTSDKVDRSSKYSSAESRNAQQRTATTTKSSTATKSKDNTTRKQPRTRAGSTFMDEATQMATNTLQDAVGAVVTDDMERIALAEFTARTLKPQVLGQITNDLNALAAALDNGTNASNLDVGDMEQLVEFVRVGNEALYSEIALATIKFYGHEVIDYTGESIIDFAMGTLGGAEAAVDNVAGAICSVASLPSGVPCNIVKGIVSFLFQQIAVPAANASATLAVHEMWKMTADCGADAVRAGLDPAQAKGCGETISSTLRWFPKTSTQAISFAMPYLDETQAGLYEYHSAVLNLALAARAASSD